MKTINLPKEIDRIWVEETGMNILSDKNRICIDCSEIQFFDSAAVAFFKLISQNKNVKIVNISDEIKKILRQVDYSQSKIPSKKTNFVELLGDFIANLWDEFCKALVVLVEMVYWGTIGLLWKRDFRKGVLGEQMYNLGYGALGITVVLTFLIGVAVATQSAIQLKQFGADVFLVMLVVISMIREMGPLMTAIILAGRTGSATTAEIATMKVQEEIDALKTMGLNEIQFVVVPKFWALSITMPLLSVLATLSGILGGFFVAYFYSGLSIEIIVDEFAKNVIFKDFVISLIKSLVFSWLILWIGTYYGFGVRGGAEEVGKATTKSVVSAIFVIVITDALFSFLY
ncbi:MAG: MlaE family lipid ABC transporter permease subunit [Chitinispirillales bacterium]|jgi:phospholipid/cholesterol/gamma-HCH transport system permease protein|nr:MlaE family lipid ABC transporter permease subunit [Chitinispirillales bacterium]